MYNTQLYICIIERVCVEKMMSSERCSRCHMSCVDVSRELSCGVGYLHACVRVCVVCWLNGSELEGV